jgi:hypothetical protein
LELLAGGSFKVTMNAWSTAPSTPQRLVMLMAVVDPARMLAIRKEKII